MRQIDEVAHVLTSAPTSLTSFRDFADVFVLLLLMK